MPVDYNAPVKPSIAAQLLVWLKQQKGTVRRRADEAKVDNGTVSRWIRGKSTPHQTTIDKLVEVAKKYGFAPIDPKAEQPEA